MAKSSSARAVIEGYANVIHKLAMQNLRVKPCKSFRDIMPSMPGHEENLRLAKLKAAVEN